MNSTAKSLRMGEIGLMLVFAALAVLWTLIYSKAYSAPYAFHAGLFAIGSVAAIYAIFQRYEKRDAAMPPAMIDGRPNYNFGPVKFASLAALFWGLAGMTVGLYLALELAFPILNMDTAFINFGRLRPLLSLIHI